MSRTIKNKALISPSYDLDCLGSNAVYLNGTDQYIEIEVVEGEFYTFTNPVTQEIKTYNHLGEEQT